MTEALEQKNVVQLRLMYHLKERLSHFSALARLLDAQIENARNSYTNTATTIGYIKLDAEYATGQYTRTDPDGKDLSRVTIDVYNNLKAEERSIDAAIRSIPKSTLHAELRRIMLDAEMKARALPHTTDIVPRPVEDIGAPLEKRSFAVRHFHDPKKTYIDTNVLPHIHPKILRPPEESKGFFLMSTTENSFAEEQVNLFVPTVHWVNMADFTSWKDRNVSKVTFPPQLFGHRHSLKDLLELPSGDEFPSARPFNPSHHQIFSVWVANLRDSMKSAHEYFRIENSSRTLLLDPCLKTIPLRFLDAVYLDCIHEFDIQSVLVFYGPAQTTDSEHDFVAHVSIQNVPEADRICLCSESITFATRLRDFQKRLLRAHAPKRAATPEAFPSPPAKRLREDQTSDEEGEIFSTPVTEDEKNDKMDALPSEDDTEEEDSTAEEVFE